MFPYAHYITITSSRDTEFLLAHWHIWKYFARSIFIFIFLIYITIRYGEFFHIPLIQYISTAEKDQIDTSSVLKNPY